MPLKSNTPLFTFVMKAANSNASQLLTKPLQPKIHFRLRTLMAEGRSNPRCAYWSFPDTSGHATDRRAARGRWSSKGCTVTGVYPTARLYTSYAYVNCSCDRVAPVTVLMDVAPSTIVLEESVAQSVASYVGLVSAIALLALTFTILTIIRGLRTNTNDIHRNIALCLLMAQLLFLIALKFRDELIQREVSAALRHCMYVCVHVCVAACATNLDIQHECSAQREYVTSLTRKKNHINCCIASFLRA